MESCGDCGVPITEESIWIYYRRLGPSHNASFAYSRMSIVSQLGTNPEATDVNWSFAINFSAENKRPLKT